MTTTLPTENVSCTYFGNAFSSSRTFSEASNRWLRLKSRSTSRRRCFAPSASRRARSARLLATSAVTRKANNATQFWGSAMVNVPTGGRKKKLKAAVAPAALALQQAQLLGPRAAIADKASLDFFTTTYRQHLVFEV